MHLGRGIVGQQEQELPFQLLALLQALEHHADDRRVDERRARQVDHERRFRPERGCQVVANARSRVRIGLAT